MANDEPSAEVIARLKEKYPDRSLHLVDVTHGDDKHYFVMTGANHYEYKKFNDEILGARDTGKTEADKNDKLMAAVRTAAIAMIRWPDRPDVEKLFHDKPGMVAGFAEQIHEHAGTNSEVRSKKL